MVLHYQPGLPLALTVDVIFPLPPAAPFHSLLFLITRLWHLLSDLHLLSFSLLLTAIYSRIIHFYYHLEQFLLDIV
jgi:hypothetical protein